MSSFVTMSETSNKHKHDCKVRTDEAASNTIGAFTKRLKRQVDNIDISMKGKVKAVRVVPKAIGKHQYGNIWGLC